MKTSVCLAFACIVTLSLSSCATTEPTTSPVTSISAQKADLGKLYKSYVTRGHSTLSMPEYKKAVEVTGVVLQQSKSVTGNVLTSVSAVGSNRLMARLVPANANEATRMAAFSAKKKITTVCTVDFASGTEYLPLTDCYVK